MVVVEGLGIPKGRFRKGDALCTLCFPGHQKEKERKSKKKKKALFVELVRCFVWFYSYHNALFLTITCYRISARIRIRR